MPSTYEPLATTTLTSAASSITFSSISGSYTDLKIVLLAKQDTGSTNMLIQLNSDTGTNYSNTNIYAGGSSVTSSRGTSQAFIVTHTPPTTSNFALLEIDLFSYAGSTNKTVLIAGNNDNNGSGETVRVVGLWRSTAAITAIKLYPFSNNLASGSTATLYGITKA